MNKYAPISFFVYNRPDKTQISLKSLEENELSKHSNLFIFSDGAKDDDTDRMKVNKVRSIIKKAKNFNNVQIIEREKNYWLYKNFTQGITEICNKFEKIIVIEDDNEVSKYFLNFINDGLNTYQNELKVCAINAWFFPEKNNLNKTFFIKGGDTWGWGTWKRAWDKFNPNTEYLINELNKRNLIKKFNFNNSFDFFKMLKKRNKNLNESHTIIWKASTFLEGMLSLHPSNSLVKNIGFDGSGTHNKNVDNTHSHSSIENIKINVEKIKIEEDIKAVKFIENFYKKKKIDTFKNKVFKKISEFFGS